MAPNVTTAIFQRGGAGAVRPGSENQVSRPDTRATPVSSARFSARRSQSARSGELSHRSSDSGSANR
jgi:hypothetical protein